MNKLSRSPMSKLKVVMMTPTQKLFLDHSVYAVGLHGRGKVYFLRAHELTATFSRKCWHVIQREEKFIWLLVYSIRLRSVELDEWTPEQLKIMQLSGNGNAASFFRANGMVYLS